MQVFRYYGAALIRHGIRERDFSSVDFTLMLCPFMVLAIVRLILGFVFAAFGFVTWTSQIESSLNLITTTVTSVFGMMVFVSLTILVEHDKLGATNKELFAYALSFPIFMLSYVPIAFQAIFSKSEWKPIQHTGH